MQNSEAEIKLSEATRRFLEKKIRELSERTGIPVETLWDRYTRYKQDIRVTLSDVSPDEEAVIAMNSFICRTLASQGTKTILFIPIGFGFERTTRNGTKMSRIYGLYREENDESYRPGVLIGRGEDAKVWAEVQLFYAYRIKVSGSKPGVFWVTPDTVFDNEQAAMVGTTVNDKLRLLVRMGVKKFTLREIYDNISRRDENGFVDDRDIRGLEGVIVAVRSGKRQDGSEWFQYMISDPDLAMEKDDIVTEDGRVIPRQLTVWVPRPVFHNYPVGTQVFIYGHVIDREDDVPYMNAIGLIPIMIPEGGV